MYTYYSERVFDRSEWAKLIDPDTIKLNKCDEINFDDENSIIVITRSIGIIEKITAIFELIFASFLALFNETSENNDLLDKAWAVFDKDSNRAVCQYAYRVNHLDLLSTELIAKIIDYFDIPEKILFGRAAKAHQELLKLPEAWQAAAEKIELQLVPKKKPSSQIKKYVQEWRKAVRIAAFFYENKVGCRGITSAWPFLFSMRVEDIVKLQYEHQRFLLAYDKINLGILLGNQIKAFDIPGWNHIHYLHGVVPLIEQFDSWCQKNAYDLGKHIHTITGIFSFFPTEIRYLTSLTELNITLSGQFSEPRSLKTLTLKPDLIGLANLKTLTLKADLTELPEFVEHLPNLKSLQLKYNKFEKFPDNLAKLTHLEELSIGGNQIKELPPEIGNMTNLISLGVWGNRLSSLPREMGNLVNLCNLYLVYKKNKHSDDWLLTDDNNFKDIPLEILLLPNLDYRKMTINSQTVWNTLRNCGKYELIQPFVFSLGRPVAFDFGTIVDKVLLDIEPYRAVTPKYMVTSLSQENWSESSHSSYESSSSSD